MTHTNPVSLSYWQTTVYQSGSSQPSLWERTLWNWKWKWQKNKNGDLNLENRIMKKFCFSLCFCFNGLFWSMVNKKKISLWFILWPWKRPVGSLGKVCLQLKHALHGYGGRAGCPWAWWWHAWRGWRTGWCPRTDRGEASEAYLWVLKLEVLGDHKTLVNISCVK